MLHIDLTLEDTRIVANRDNSNVWIGFICDAPTGKCVRIEWTDSQIAAVVALGFGIGENDEIDESSVKKLYEIAEPAIKDLPSECRPIP